MRMGEKKNLFKSQYLSALAIILLISLFALLFKLSRNPIFSENDSNIIGNFIEWFGVLYGVMLALVVVEVWKRFNSINSEVDREADALVLVLRTARHLGDKIFLKRLAERLKAYAITSQELTNTETAAYDPDNDVLDIIYGDINALLSNKSAPTILETEMLRQVHVAIDAQGDRLGYIYDRMPKPLWVAIVVTSIIWILGFFGLRIESDWLAILICGAAVFSVSLIILIIKDLDTTEGGVWKTQIDSFKVLEDVAEKILHQISETNKK